MQGFHRTDAKYLEVVELLKNTYCGSSHQIEAHLHAILDLPTPGGTAADLSLFRSSYEGHLRGLKNLGKDIEAVGFVLVAIILRKLCPTVRNNMNREGKKEQLDLFSLRSAIEVEIEHLKASEATPAPVSGMQFRSEPYRADMVGYNLSTVSANQRKCFLCDSPQHAVVN